MKTRQANGASHVISELCSKGLEKGMQCSGSREKDPLAQPRGVISRERPHGLAVGAENE